MNGEEVIWSININGTLSTYGFKPKSIRFKNNFQLKPPALTWKQFYFWIDYFILNDQRETHSLMRLFMRIAFQLSSCQACRSESRSMLSLYPCCQSSAGQIIPSMTPKKINLCWFVLPLTVLFLQLLLQLYCVHLALYPVFDCSQ